MSQYQVSEYGWTSPDENPNTEGTYAHFVMNVKSAVKEMTKSIVRVVNSPHSQHTRIGLAGNKNLALFISDLIPMLSRQQIFELGSEYNKNMQGMDDPSGDCRVL